MLPVLTGCHFWTEKVACHRRSWYLDIAKWNINTSCNMYVHIFMGHVYRGTPGYSMPHHLQGRYYYKIYEKNGINAILWTRATVFMIHQASKGIDHCTKYKQNQHIFLWDVHMVPDLGTTKHEENPASQYRDHDDGQTGWRTGPIPIFPDSAIAEWGIVNNTHVLKFHCEQEKTTKIVNLNKERLILNPE